MIDHWDVDNPKQLKDRYPFMFSGHNVGFGFYKGWIHGFAKLCRDIDLILGENKRGFHFVQIKQKFGSARYYCEFALDFKRSPEDEAIIANVYAAIDEAESATCTQCIVCGKPGEIDYKRHYALTLCKEHQNARKRGKLPDAWFSDDYE